MNLDLMSRDNWTLLIAGIGAVLGLYNTFIKPWREGRVCLEVVPKLYTVMDGRRGLTIEVLNKSKFPLWISSLGFVQPNQMRSPMGPGQVAGPFQLPANVQPRQRLTAYLLPGIEKSRDMASARSVYATTQCGSEFRGTSRVFKALVKSARTHHKL